MASLKTSFLTYLVLVLSLFNITVASAILPRQSPSASTTISSADCTSYARTANVSVVGSNSTLRGAFLRSAPMGTFMAASILDKEIVNLPALQMDSELNGQCGNLTTIAFEAAATNFTQGTVLGFRILTDVGAPPGGFEMPLSWGVISLLMVGVFTSV